MLSLTLKMAWRHARKNRSYTIISALSLVLGITCFVLISIWARHELSYDKSFYRQTGNVYRIESTLQSSDGSLEEISATGWPAGKIIQANYPEVERLAYARDWRPIIRHQDAYYNEDALVADESFVQVIGLPMVDGNAATALQQPRSLMLSESLSRKYFGNSNPMGQSMFIGDTIPYTVTGVFKDLPDNTHLRFDVLASFSTFCANNPEACEEGFRKGWFDMNVYNYVKLRPDADAKAFEAKIRNLVQVHGKKAVDEFGYKCYFNLRPFDEIYLYSNMATGFGKTGSYRNVKLYMGIALFVLLIACFNFINLTTVRSIDRAKEIGVQKVLGNVRQRIVRQFLTETALLCSIATVVSVLVIASLLPYFNQFTEKTFTLRTAFSTGNVLIIVGVLLLLIPMSGFYPAIILSGYDPIKVLKGKFARSSGGTWLRKTLVTVQMVISVSFILAILVIWKQLSFMQQQDPGFDRDQVLVADVEKLPWDVRHDKAEAFKQALMQIPGVLAVTNANAVPGRSGWDGQFAYAEGRPKEQGVSIEYIPVDDQYVPTIGLKLVAGRDFYKGSKADENSFIINEAAVQTFGWGSPQAAIGKKLSTSGVDGTVVGVVKDYHQHGLQRKISGVVLHPVNYYINVFALRFEGRQAASVMQQTQAVYDQFFKGYQARLNFIDDFFAAQYKKEQQFKRYIGIAALVSILICSMGLLGLSMYTAQQRSKEISIRRVLGADTTGIVRTLSKELFALAMLAMLIGIPLTWWIMQQWLGNFAYRTTISWWVLAGSAAAVTLLALLTVGVQALKAAWANPVSNLRSE